MIRALLFAAVVAGHSSQAAPPSVEARVAALERQVLAMQSAAGAEDESRPSPAGGYVVSLRDDIMPYGRYVARWNVSGSLIPYGSVVMADSNVSPTAPPIALGKGMSLFRAKSLGARGRCIGIALDDVPAYMRGRVLVDGWHPAVRVSGRMWPGASMMPADDGTMEMALPTTRYGKGDAYAQRPSQFVAGAWGCYVCFK